MAASFINDGYTRNGYIAAKDGFYDDPLRFVYRPCSASNKAAILELTNKYERTGQLEQLERSIAEWACKRLVSWDLKDAGIHDVAITPANWLKLESNLSNRLFSVLIGSATSDFDPQLEKSGADEDAQLKN